MQEDNTPELLPGLDALGFGYDVRDRYASPVSLKLPIIDMGDAESEQTINSRQYMVPNSVTVNVHSMYSSTYEEASGKSIEEYRTSLNVNTKIEGSYYFFSGSLEVDFNMDEMQNSENEFTTVRNIIDLWTLNLPDVDTLTLIQTAQDDIDGTTGMSGIDVLNKYGSHFVWQGVVGGRADYSSATDKMTFDQSYDINVASEMSYQNAVGSISASNQTKYAAEIQEFNESSSTQIFTMGGDPTLGSQIANGQFDAWASSVPDNPVIIDFTQNSLVPIWNLCQDANRSKELSDAFQQYMETSSEPINQTEPIVEVTFTDELIYAGTDHDSGAKKDCKVYKPSLSQGYYWLGHYAQGDHNQPTGTLAIIKSLTPGSVAAPTGYTKVWQNKNDGYYYGCWKPIAPPGYKALGYLMKMWTHDSNPPSGDMVAGLMCVHESLVVKGQSATDDIWDDHGTGASTDCSIFSLLPVDNGGINAGTFYGQGYNGSHDPNPTSPQAYVLDRSKVEISNPDMEPS